MEDERKDYLKALSRQCKRETLFCDMDDYTVNLFSSEDTYPSYFHTFEMDGFTAVSYTHLDVYKRQTYNAGTYITHVGLYVGNNRMYHAGNPIGYADLTGSY